MKKIQMTLDEDLLDAVDKSARWLGTSRSAFARDALRQALARLREERLGKRHRTGYERRPVRAGEFDVWESEQVWPD